MSRRCIDQADRDLVRAVAEHQPCTVRELAASVDLSVSVIHHRVLLLSMRQVLRREPGLPRTIRLHPSVVVHEDAIYQLEKMP